MKQLWQQIFQYALAAIIVFALLAVVLVLIFSELDASVQDALLILLGVLASGFTAVIGYFFGSSKGSADKNEMMKK
jgi:hypothetical protein